LSVASNSVEYDSEKDKKYISAEIKNNTLLYDNSNYGFNNVPIKKFTPDESHVVENNIKNGMYRFYLSNIIISIPNIFFLLICLVQIIIHHFCLWSVTCLNANKELSLAAPNTISLPSTSVDNSEYDNL